MKIKLLCAVSIFLFSNLSSYSAHADRLFIDSFEDPYSTPPCKFSLQGPLQEGTTLNIDCVLDLDTQNVDLPKDFHIVYAGGIVINGALNFDSGSIDGRLLNTSLEVSGQAVLRTTAFKFQPRLWNIIQGEVTEPQAYANKVEMQRVVDLVKSLSGTEFYVDRLDAYFEARTQYIGAIDMPSDFSFQMSNNTFLRVFPLDADYSTILLRVYDARNVKISGGHIVGDRLQHGPTDGGRITVEVKGGENVVIQNMHISLSSSTGLTINSILFEGDPRYVQSRNVVVKNCIFDSNRNNNLSITDGENITVENNKLYRAGNDMEGAFGTSFGRAPRIAIVVEPVQGQIARDITIRNNVIEETRTNSILAALGQGFVITGNTADGAIGWTSASAVQVSDNTLLGGGIIGGFTGGYALSQSRDNVISDNLIQDCATGIRATNDDIEIFNNTITNCDVGIMLNSLSDSTVFNNNINNTISNSFGINAQEFVDNVSITENTIDILGRSMWLMGINDEPDQQDYLLEIDNNHFTAGNTGKITSSRGVNVTNNVFRLSGFSIGNSSELLFSGNDVRNSFGPSLSINKSTRTTDIQIVNNQLENTNDARLSAYGIRINKVGSDWVSENTGVLIDNNNITVNGQNYSFHSTNFDDVTVVNNHITSEDYVSIYFRGDNSTIQNNQLNNGTDIEGDNNTVNN